jgi:hypothetical protein
LFLGASSPCVTVSKETLESCNIEKWKKVAFHHCFSILVFKAFRRGSISLNGHGRVEESSIVSRCMHVTPIYSTQWFALSYQPRAFPSVQYLTTTAATQGPETNITFFLGHRDANTAISRQVRHLACVGHDNEVHRCTQNGYSLVNRYS